MICPKYKLIKDLVHHILSRCDVHNGLHYNDEFFKQVLMFLRAIAHRQAGLHGVELIPSLDLRRGQRHRRAMTNAVEGDFLNAGQNAMKESIDEGTPSIYGIRSRVRCQLELQLHCHG